MDAYFFHILFFSSLFLSIEAFEANCPTVKCGHGGPDIHFPFHVKGQQPQYSGHSGFELVCKDNTTIIHFPSYGNLAVKSISYDTKRINLFDPKNCVHEVFLNLNFSLTPFSYYYFVKNYTYLNCSTRLSPSFIEVPCLSGSSHHVYTVESTLAVPVSCRPVKTMAIPFSYSPYLADNSFGLGLTWSFNGCEDCEAKRGQWGFQSKSGLQTGCLNAEQDKGNLHNLLFSFHDSFISSAHRNSRVVNIGLCMNRLYIS